MVLHPSPSSSLSNSARSPAPGKFHPMVRDIKPRTPHLNSKVERSHRVDQQEFYQLLDKDGIADDIHLFNDKLREWENY